MLTHVYVICEGPTEESFVNKVLYDHFQRLNIYLYPILLITNPNLGRRGKGGVTTYAKLRQDILIHAKQKQNAWITTLLDLYGLPKDTPGQKTNLIHLDNVQHIEKNIELDIGHHKFKANLVLHEFEGLLFSDPNAFHNTINDPIVLEALKQVSSQFATPEHINNSQETAPSKRIMKLIPNYKKVIDGTIIAKAIGLPTIRAACPHFNQWITWLESIEV